MEATHERWAEPELHRMRGLLLERQGDDPATVEACHRRAMASARSLGAKAWELRATSSLAAYLRAQGQDIAARQMLNTALAAFSEFGGSRDFVEALSQLKELQSLPA